MFDLGFTELLIIGVVALVVLGPERLPEVARTAGKYIAQAQRYISNLKAEFNRETQLAEFKKLREEISSSADALKSSVTDLSKSVDSEARDINAVMREKSDDLKGDPYTTFNQSEATLSDDDRAIDCSPSQPSSFVTNNPFGWNMPRAETTVRESQYIPRRYKQMATVDDLAQEIEELRQALAMHRKPMSGNNRRYAPRARVNRTRIYR